MKTEKKQKKAYSKPTMEKKKSVAVISGSSSSSGCGCNYYVSRTCNLGGDTITYYH